MHILGIQLHCGLHAAYRPPVIYWSSSLIGWRATAATVFSAISKRPLVGENHSIGYPELRSFLCTSFYISTSATWRHSRHSPVLRAHLYNPDCMVRPWRTASPLEGRARRCRCDWRRSASVIGPYPDRFVRRFSRTGSGPISCAWRDIDEPLASTRPPADFYRLATCHWRNRIGG